MKRRPNRLQNHGRTMIVAVLASLKIRNISREVNGYERIDFSAFRLTKAQPERGQGMDLLETSTRRGFADGD